MNNVNWQNSYFHSNSLPLTWPAVDALIMSLHLPPIQNFPMYNAANIKMLHRTLISDQINSSTYELASHCWSLAILLSGITSSPFIYLFYFYVPHRHSLFLSSHNEAVSFGRIILCLKFGLHYANSCLNEM